MDNHVEELRKHYIKHPPEGMTKSEIRRMTDEELLDMDYFLHEDDDIFDDDDAIFIPFQGGFWI